MAMKTCYTDLYYANNKCKGNLFLCFTIVFNYFFVPKVLVWQNLIVDVLRKITP